MRTIRIKFTKKNEGAYISLLDLQRVMSRAMKRAGIPAWYSKGFNPHIYMSFAAPLALGHYSLCETMDFKTESDTENWSEYKQKLSDCLPRGLDVISMDEAKDSPDKIAFAEYEIAFFEHYAKAFELACKKYNLLEKAEIEKQTKRGKKLIDLKDSLKAIESTNGKAIINLPAGNTLNINPELLLEFLEGLNGAPKQYAHILRLRILNENGGLFE